MLHENHIGERHMLKSIRVTSEDYTAIKELAKREGRTIAATLRLIIKNALGGVQ